MIVGDGEVGRLVDENGAEDIGNGGNGWIGGTAGELPHADQPAISVEGEDEEFFDREMYELGSKQMINCFAV